ncbi:6,7-dimethyl-8-ribityllumazine synthase [Aliifodinibius sp. S!AR15-10]|uniref:6,7-dimethyl-8-ribityllumazine synthase n=1 Tax=Aliifodinibius sp. S!AR15-10 TaxID=2950437 RepID=UPI00286278CE|nr:6,7-dimethyl-8-ribityllumazine synthase [Aliifodinibius sp. S!AR15-10]MDR8389791.1 6,7-dimethyl-8-ribityllumazine synthase [Aliifodinibius sp. S!AR15-10]
MPVQTIEADLTENSYKIGIAAARWNSFVTDKMLDGALDLLKSKGISEEDIIVVRCPGSYELPLTVKKLLDKVDGVIAIGAVIRGDTPHFDYVCNAVNRGISDLNLSSGKPVAFGVLTTDTVEQATIRADAESSKGNKGTEAALAVLEMISLTQQIDSL